MHYKLLIVIQIKKNDFHQKSDENRFLLFNNYQTHLGLDSSLFDCDITFICIEF